MYIKKNKQHLVNTVRIEAYRMSVMCMEMWECVTFELTAVVLMVHIQDMKLCHPVGGSWHFTEQQCLNLLDTGDNGTTVLSVITNHLPNTWCHVLEHLHLQQQYCEILKYHTVIFQWVEIYSSNLLNHKTEYLKISGHKWQAGFRYELTKTSHPCICLLYQLNAQC